MNRTRLQLFVLGRFRLTTTGGAVSLGSKKLCGLLAFLACTRTPQPRERLMTLLWGSHFETQAQQNLRQAVARLRRALGDDVVITTDHLISIAPEAIECDAERFEASIREGSITALATAASTYQGSLLSDVSISEENWTEWIRAERSRLESLALDALVQLAELQLKAGQPVHALETANKAVAIDELREDVHRTIIKVLMAIGRRAEALRQYQDLVAILKRALNVEPDPATRALIDEARASQVSMAPRAALEGSGERSESIKSDLIIPQNLGKDIPALLFVDADANQTPSRRDLVEHICRQIVQTHNGRVIESDGAGLVLRFPHPRAGAAAAFDIQTAIAHASLGPGEPSVSMGMHVHSFGDDSPEESIKLAERLSKVAGPNDIIVSEDTREHLTPSLDAELDDLGEAARGLRGSVRGFRISPPIQQPQFLSDDSAPLWPTIAIIPFPTSGDEPAYRILGDILADEIIAGLSHNSEVTVISRLSTTALRGRDVSLGQMRSLLGATYVLSGNCHVAAGSAQLILELADARSGNVVWADRLTAPVSEVAASGGIIDDVIGRLCASIMRCESARARMKPLPTLENSTLLLGAVALMHQLSRSSVEHAREMLETLVERVPSHPMPHAWLAHLYSLRSNQGWVYDFKAEAQLALDSTKRALDADPNCSLALAIDGYVHTHFLKRFDLAIESFDLAVEINPNDALAWLLKSTMHSFKGEGDLAMEGAGLALRLSPLDPRRWFFDALAAAAALASGSYDRAIELARRSIRSNRTHTSSFRALAVAQVMAGRIDDARHTAAELMQLQPDLTVTQYLQRHPAAAFPTGSLWGNALRDAGVPK